MADTESRSERSGQAVHEAVAGLAKDVWTASTRAELLQIRTVAEESIAALMAVSSAVLTLVEHFEDRR